MKRNSGFTLIELVIVIIVLGILAATAVPKFINLQDDAKASAMKGVEAAVHSAANIIYSKSAIENEETIGDQKITDNNGADINTQFGYPAAVDGIVKSVDLTGFSEMTPKTLDETSIIFAATNDQLDGDICLLYTQAADKDNPYKVLIATLDTGDCK